MIFNKEDKISFQINDCIQKNFIFIQKVEEKNNNEFESKFNEDLEILIRLYYFNKQLKDKDNTNFSELKEENIETVYLINNSWLEKYKSFFSYNELENILNPNEKNKVTNTFISQDSIMKIISNLPKDYINKIKVFYKKEKFDYEYNNLNNVKNNI